MLFCWRQGVAVGVSGGRQYVGPDGLRRRHHVHGTVIQRAVKRAVRQSGLGKRAHV
jgi:hypothetical protein